jgi:hypothetical protein
MLGIDVSLGGSVSPAFVSALPLQAGHFAGKV